MNVYKICMKLAINDQKCPTLACFWPSLKNFNYSSKNHCFLVFKTLANIGFWTFINVQFSIPFCRFGKIHRFTLPYHKFSKTRIKNKICEHIFFSFFDVFVKSIKMTKKVQILGCKFRNQSATDRNKKLHRFFDQNAHTMYAAGFRDVCATLLRLPTAATNPAMILGAFAHKNCENETICGLNMKI
jgi:hypothetical protein